ncbi:hypothetical protein Tco_0597710 [Tanacetum coccineum]
MELENSQNNALAKLPMLKLGEYEMWEIRIKQYFQIQDYALWEVIENGNSIFFAHLGTAHMNINLPFDQYVDAQSMFAAIKARFGGNEATRKTQKALLKQQYENFNASSSESLDSIFNRLQKLVSRLAILVWMNKPDFDTMGLDDLYNNFKIVEQKVKRSAGANNDDKNLAFLTTSGTDISQKDEKPSKKRQNRTRDGKVCEDEAQSKSRADYANLGNFIYKRKKGEKENEKKKDVEGLFFQHPVLLPYFYPATLHQPLDKTFPLTPHGHNAKLAIQGHFRSKG